MICPRPDPLRTITRSCRREAMVTMFECLGCGHESILQKLPAKCPECGNGNGLLRESAESAAPPPPRQAPPDRLQGQ